MTSTPITRYFLVVLVSLLTLTLSTVRVGAQTAPATSYAFTVNTTADTHDANPGDGVCADSNGQCSLRAAIEESDALPSGSSITITVPAGTYSLTLGTLGLTAQSTITINGAGRKTTIIKGNSTFEIMHISAGVNASLNGLAIERGKTGGNGGGIENAGILLVSNSTISHNSAPHGYGGGGGIDNVGVLTVSNSTISRNSAGGGGGISNNPGGTLTVSNSTISGNSANGGHSHGYGEGDGGGILNGGTLTVSNSTFSGNSAIGSKNDFGGGIDNYDGTLTVTSSTFSGNSAGSGGNGYGGGIENGQGGSGATVTVTNSTFSNNVSINGSGGGIENDGATLSVSNSTISGNSGTYGGAITNYGNTITLTATIVANSPKGPNCTGTITDGGSNLDSGTSCSFSLSTDLNNTNPMLGPLRNNGGHTQTMALLKGSPAIDWVAASSCPATDQRGYMRPDNGESTCDIGAFESSY